MSETKIEVLEDGAVTLRPSPDQLTAWSRSAAEQPLTDWLVELADDAATALSYEERTWPAVIPLKHPIEVGKRTITELTMRRGKLGDIKGIKLGGDVPTEQLITIASRLAGEPTVVIERLDAEDSGEVMAIALDFYSRSLGGGRKR